MRPKRLRQTSSEVLDQLVPESDLHRLVLSTLVEDTLLRLLADELLDDGAVLSQPSAGPDGSTLLELAVRVDGVLRRLTLKTIIAAHYRWDGEREHARIVDLTSVEGIGLTSLGSLLTTYRHRLSEVGLVELTPDQRESLSGPSPGGETSEATTETLVDWPRVATRETDVTGS